MEKLDEVQSETDTEESEVTGENIAKDKVKGEEDYSELVKSEDEEFEEIITKEYWYEEAGEIEQEAEEFEDEEAPKAVKQEVNYDEVQTKRKEAEDEVENDNEEMVEAEGEEDYLRGEDEKEYFPSREEVKGLWDAFEVLRRTHSDASHNLLSPNNSRTFLFLRQKSFVTIFESLALASVLETLDLELEVLGHAFPGHFATSDESDFLSYDERFSRETKERELFHLPTLKHFKDPFLVDQSQLGTREDRFARKLQKDRAFLQQIIAHAKDEMLAERSFEKLKNHVRREDNRRNEEVTLLERMDKAKLAVKKLKHRMTEYEAQMNRHEQNRQEMIRELRDELHGEKQKGKMEARYSRAWFQAQNRLHYETMKNDSEIAKLRLKVMEIQMTRDRLAHTNIKAWTALRCDEILFMINNWKVKLENDGEDIDKRIQEKRFQILEQEGLIQALHQSIDERMIELGPYEEEKERLRLERISNLRLYYSARKIQRWWRAYMKKNNLYKKKKKGKGKGRSKKKRK